MQKKLKSIDDIWSHFREGNDLAFYLLYDQYADDLYKYGIRFSKDKEFIKDCIHDLFFDLYKYRNKLSATDSIKFYLFRSLRRIIHKEQVKLIPFVFDKMFIPSAEDPVFSHEDYLISVEIENENHKALNEACKRLTNRQREGLSLKFEHDHTYPQIGEIMGISTQSARTLIYRALKELRKCIDEGRLGIHILFFLSLKS